MPFLFYDSTMLILLSALILSFYAQYKVQSTFNRYISIANYGGYTGAEVAKNFRRYGSGRYTH